MNFVYKDLSVLVVSRNAVAGTPTWTPATGASPPARSSLSSDKPSEISRESGGRLRLMILTGDSAPDIDGWSLTSFIF